jgi:hypothetical protein
MAIDRYVMNHRLLIRMQRSGNVFCEVCHKPIVEGQRVVWVTRVIARHYGCPVPATSKTNDPILT